MRFDYPDWTKKHKPHWQDLLLAQMDLNEPVTFIEVGCFEGRSTVWFANYLGYHPNSVMYCIDTWEGGEEVERAELPFNMNQVHSNFMFNINTHEQRHKIFPIKERSEPALARMLQRHYRKVDFIYLDGSHTRRDTLVDLVLALSAVRKGGLIIVDDYLNKMATDDLSLRPREAVDFVVKSFNNEIEFFVTPDEQAVIIRKE